MYSRVLKSLCLALALAAVALGSVAVSAQAMPAAKGTAVDDSPSRWDIFAGYSYLAPHGTVNGTTYQSINLGAIGSVARYFNNNVGVEISFDTHPQHDTNDGFWGGSEGVIFRVPTADITPFVHAMIGFEHGGGTYQQGNIGPVFTIGGGMDYATPLFDRKLAIRIFQADYQYSHINFGVNGRGNFNMARLSAGVVFHVGEIAPPPPVTLACSVNPTTPVFPGDPVTVTASAGALNPKLTAAYAWSGAGVTGNGTTATVKTDNQDPGTYTVKATVTETKPGKTEIKPGDVADCSATYTVKAYEPPTVSCTANPTTIKPGDSSTVTTVAVSPQNRPLTYSYSATAGTIGGTGTTASYSSAGAPTGAVGITCSVSDDKGHTATANTEVTIVAPPPPPAPHTQALCSITFDKDKKRPERVDNEAKACLDQVALDLQNQADAKAMVVGESDAKEKAKMAKEEKFAEKHKHAKVEDAAAQRAVNTKEYLVTEKGIDPSRVGVATGTTDGKTVEDYLVPAGATFTSDVPGTTPVDETKVKPVARKPLGEKHHAKKKAM